MPIVGILSILAGAAVIVSTFLSWVSAGPFGGYTGWQALTESGTYSTQGNFIILYGDGIIFFTGFWALLVGGLLLLAGLILIFKARAGGTLTLIFAVIGTSLAAVNVVMIYTRVRSLSAGIGISPGVGLWMFVGCSVVALVLGIVGVGSRAE